MQALSERFGSPSRNETAVNSTEQTRIIRMLELLDEMSTNMEKRFDDYSINDNQRIFSLPKDGGDASHNT